MSAVKYRMDASLREEFVGDVGASARLARTWTVRLRDLDSGEEASAELTPRALEFLRDVFAPVVKVSA